MKNMKRLLAILTVVAMLFTVSSFAEKAAPEEGTLALNQTSVTMDYSQRVTLTAANGGESIRWTSSDENVARLDVNRGESVEVAGINAGTATITCTSGDQQHSCEVTVTAPGTLQITGVDYPSTYRMAGRGWKLRRGILASNVDLATLTTVLKDANGTVIGSAYTHTFESGVRRYEINGLDNYVHFSWIDAEGTYTWLLSAMDANGRIVSVSLPINAVADGETVVTNDPGNVTSGSEGAGTLTDDTQAEKRNLILNSMFSGMEDAGIYTFNGDEVTFHTTEFNAESVMFRLKLSEYGIDNIPGKALLFSMEYRIDEKLEFGTTNPWVGFELSVIRDETTGGSDQWPSWYGATQIPTEVTDGWVRYSCVVQVSDYSVLDTSSIAICFRDTKGTICFRHPKIEIINTNWSPAPEDVDYIGN